MTQSTDTRPSDIVGDFRPVVAAAAPGKGTEPTFLTAYQVLDRLPADLRTRLVAERGRGGRGEGKHFAATGIVMHALRLLHDANEIDVEYLDTGGLLLTLNGETIEAGDRVCGLYRLRP